MSILQRGRRYVVSSVAFLFLASTGFTLAGPPKLAFADTVKQGSAMGYSGCIPGITQFGAELFVHLDATATWSNGSHRVTVNSADARLDIRDCGTCETGSASAIRRASTQLQAPALPRAFSVPMESKGSRFFI